MSKGAGIVERRIADLLSATRDRALSIDDITDAAFTLKGKTPTRAQRLSATRAAHRLLERIQQKHRRNRALLKEAHARTEAAVGSDTNREAYQAHLEADAGYIEARKLGDEAKRIGQFFRLTKGDQRGWLNVEEDFWTAEAVKGRLYLRPPDVPVRAWAVSMGPGGITWSEAEVIKVTKRNVMVRYNGEIARLDREKLWYWWSFYRNVRFVSSRTGRIASELDKAWQSRWGSSGAAPPSMRMPLADAMAMLGVPTDYTKEDVISGFRQAAKRAHPDLGGTVEMFRKLVEARDRLLEALGTSAPPPKPPTYAPKGSTIVYGRGSRSSSRRLGSGRLRLA